MDSKRPNLSGNPSYLVESNMLMFRNLSASAPFRTLMFIAILAASIFAGVEVEGVQTLSAATTNTIDLTISIVFVVEIVIKLLGHGRYFFVNRVCARKDCEEILKYSPKYGCSQCGVDFYCSEKCQIEALPRHNLHCIKRCANHHKRVAAVLSVHNLNYWNLFDVVVVAAGFSPWNNVKILRLLRFIRIMRLVRAITTLRILMAGLFRSFSSILYIFLLLLLIFYVFGAIGMLLFRDHDEFHDWETTLVNLWTISFGGTWSSTMYSIMFSCNDGSSYPDCRLISDVPKGMATLLFFIAFLISTVWVFLNLVIGVITAAMDEARDLMNSEVSSPSDSMLDLAALKNVIKKGNVDEPKKESSSKLWQILLGPRKGDVRQGHDDFHMYVRMVKALVVRSTELQKRVQFLDRQSQKREKKMEQVYDKTAQSNDGSVASMMQRGYRVFCKTCSRISTSSPFNVVIMIAVVMGAVLVGIQVDSSGDGDGNSTDGSGSMALSSSSFHAISDAISAVFVAELVIRFFAHHFRLWEYIIEFNEVWPYFTLQKWNAFDVTLVFLTYLLPKLSILRLFRMLRVFKLVRMIPTLQILIGGLISSFASIIYILMLCILLFYLFAVAGVLMFQDIDPLHFENLGMAFLSLFQCASGDQWDDVFRASYGGCSTYDNYPQCTDDQAQKKGGYIAIIYWVSFMLLAAMVVFNLVIGVISSSMEDVNEHLKQAELDKKEMQRQKYLLLSKSDKQDFDLKEAMDIVEAFMAKFEDLEKVRTGRNVQTSDQNGMSDDDKYNNNNNNNNNNNGGTVDDNNNCRKDVQAKWKQNRVAPLPAYDTVTPKTATRARTLKPLPEIAKKIIPQ